MSYFNQKIGIAQKILHKLSFKEYRYTDLMSIVGTTPYKFNQALMWLCKEGYVERPKKKRGMYKLLLKGKEFLKVLPEKDKKKCE